MRKFLFLTMTIICCICLTLPASAKETVRYTKYGGCELVTKHISNFWGEWTMYGLAKQGRLVVEPNCEMWYNERLHLFVFRCDESYRWCRIMMFSADTGDCLYSASLYTGGIKSARPHINFEAANDGYINAMVYGYHDKPYSVGAFYRKDGKTYQRQLRAVAQDVPLTPAQYE